MKPQPLGPSKKKHRYPNKNVLAVNLCLPEARSAAPHGKKTLPEHPRRGTRINRHICALHRPQTSMGREWNVCMAFAQIFGDESSGCTMRKSNGGIVIRVAAARRFRAAPASAKTRMIPMFHHGSHRWARMKMRHAANQTSRQCPLANAGRNAGEGGSTRLLRHSHFFRMSHIFTSCVSVM